MKLKNKTIIITGASDGIGKEIALTLAKEKTNLILLARTESKLEDVSNICKELGAQRVNIYSCDLTKINQIKDTTKKIIEDNKEIDILINNAGIWQKLSDIENIDDEVIQNIISTNLTGLIQITKELMPQLKKREEAIIINVSSKSGVSAQKGQSVYTASKYGVRGFTEVLKTDLKETNVRVAGIYQSGTNTTMFQKQNEDFPIQKFTPPEHLADVVRYMLSLPEKIWLHDVRVEY